VANKDSGLFFHFFPLKNNDLILHDDSNHSSNRGRW
jgi:hypothetical protein